MIWGEVFLRSVQLYPFIFRRVFVSPVPRLEVHQPMVHNQEHPNPISPLRLHFAPFACWKPNPNHRKVKGKVKVGGPVVVSFQLLMPCSRNLEVSVSGVNEGWKVEKILWSHQGETSLVSRLGWEGEGIKRKGICNVYIYTAYILCNMYLYTWLMWCLLEEIWVERFRSTSDFRKLRFVVKKSLKSLRFQIYSKSCYLILKAYNKTSGLKET